MFQRAFSDLDILFCYLVLPKPTLLCVHGQQSPTVIYSFRCVLKYEGKVIEQVEVGIEYDELLTHFTGRFIFFPRSDPISSLSSLQMRKECTHTSDSRRGTR